MTLAAGRCSERLLSRIKWTMSHLVRVVEALKLASPYCLAARYDNLKHCVEASVSAAAALRRRNIKARAVPCAVWMRSPDGDRCLSIGLTPRFLYDRLTQEPKPPFDEWKAATAAAVPDEEFPLHMVIEAKLGGERAIIDLTIGQLCQVGAELAAPVPLQLAAIRRDGEWWPEFDHAGWVIKYLPSPHPPAALDPVLRDARKYESMNSGFVADLHDSIELALQCGGDVGRYRWELHSQRPIEAGEIEAKILGWMRTPDEHASHRLGDQAKRR